MNSSNEVAKPLVFCLDKSNDITLKQCLYPFSSRYFNDGKSLIKSLLLNKKTDFLPSALILTGDVHSIKEILTNQHVQSIKTFLYCSNSTRQLYESFTMESKLAEQIIGLFTTIEDLKDALEDTLIESTHHREFLRFVTDNLDSYLWYELLRETSMKIETIPPKQVPDIASINRQMEYDPLIALYTLRSAVRYFSEKTTTNKKVFYGTVIRKDLIEGLQSNIGNIISFNSFVHLQGHNRTVDARHQALQCCSRRANEVSILFELELANQPTFKIIRVFNSNDHLNLWVVQLIGTCECVKLIKQFSHIKRRLGTFVACRPAEILFGQILIEMNEIDRAYRYFFQIFINQYDRLNSIYAEANDLWTKEKKYTEAVDLIALQFQEVRRKKSTNHSTNKDIDELTYMESEFDSIWEPPLALQDANIINDLLPPISYRVDQVLLKDNLPKQPTTTATTRRRCTLF